MFLNIVDCASAVYLILIKGRIIKRGYYVELPYAYVIFDAR